MLTQHLKHGVLGETLPCAGVRISRQALYLAASRLPNKNNGLDNSESLVFTLFSSMFSIADSLARPHLCSDGFFSPIIFFLHEALKKYAKYMYGRFRLPDPTRWNKEPKKGFRSAPSFATGFAHNEKPPHKDPLVLLRIS